VKIRPIRVIRVPIVPKTNRRKVYNNLKNPSLKIQVFFIISQQEHI
jgi:hypothetical protein